MAIVVPKVGDVVDATTFGAPVANWLNALDAAWVSFTPVMAMGGGTPGTGPISGRYKMVGAKTCTFVLNWTWGTGAFGGSGEYRWNLPVNASTSTPEYSSIGTCHCAFAGGATPPRRIGTVHKLGNVLVVFLDVGQLGSTIPQSVQVNDAYYIHGTYETV